MLERAAALGSVLPEHFLFPRCRSKETRNPIRGTGYDPSRPQKGWRTAWRNLTKEAVRRAEEAGIDPAPLRGFRFHDLRHTSITRLAESGKADATTMAISGHLSKAMLDHYSHVRKAAKREAVEALKGTFEIPPEAPPATKTVQ